MITSDIIEKEYRILVRETSGAKPKRMTACEKCVFNSGQHAKFCPKYKKK